MAGTPIPSSITLPGPYRAVVTDMDGLLVQTERQWLGAKVVLFERYGAELHDDDLAAVFGAAEMDSARYFAARFGLPPERAPALRDEYLAIVSESFASGVALAPGAVELVERLAGTVPLAMASNTRRPLMLLALRAFPAAARFDVIVSGDEAEPKPAPGLYLLACERLGVPPSEAVALEDSPTGVAAAKAAGMTCIGVPSDPRHPLAEADHVVSSLLELL
jgi:HAD superfamily hydrolase (TIGR01509 family)